MSLKSTVFFYVQLIEAQNNMENLSINKMRKCFANDKCPNIEIMLNMISDIVLVI